MTQITLDEVHALSLSAADTTNDCECHAEMPGILAPCLPDNDDGHAFVQKCDACELRPDDDVAAELFAKRFGLNVHRRWDDTQFLYWRPFVSRPGDDDDHDTVCIWDGRPTGDYGICPDGERPLTADEQARADARVRDTTPKENANG